jgi:diguanylate cyclase (GGDEF)-like protein
VLIDIDHFKGLNDGLGHGAADRVLMLIAAELSRSVRRPGDLAARYGGDEFILVLSGTGPDGAMTVASQVQESINRLSLAHPGSPIDSKVTVSQGVATSWPLKKGSSNSLMLAVDRALYNAKQTGRNRIAVAGSARFEVENA